LAALLRLLDEPLDLRRAVEEAVVGVNMEVNEVARAHGVPRATLSIEPPTSRKSNHRQRSKFRAASRTCERREDSFTFRGATRRERLSTLPRRAPPTFHSAHTDVWRTWTSRERSSSLLAPRLSGCV